MKVLIYLNENKLAPVGGPLGVGYNIWTEIKKKNNTDIFFLQSTDTKKHKTFQMTRWIKSFVNLYLFPSAKNAEIMSEFDAVHFHSVKTLYKERRALKKYKGVVLLTSHSPIPMSKEMFDDVVSKFPVFKHITFLQKWFRKIDKYAFEKADYIVFPCPEAEEPYINNWPEYAKIRTRRIGFYRYALTGIVPVAAKDTRKEIRNELGIDESTFMISYVGRHNEVKGYDQLKILGERILNKNSDIFFVVCGKEFPLAGIQNERWHEVGWTNNAHSYISASDVFILPNRETYFDLVMLEVLSLGKIVVASRTGGNKFFEQSDVPGVFLYDTLEEAEHLLYKIKHMSKAQRTELERANKRYFEQNLTSEKFVDSIRKIYEEVTTK